MCGGYEDDGVTEIGDGLRDRAALRGFGDHSLGSKVERDAAEREQKANRELAHDELGRQVAPRLGIPLERRRHEGSEQRMLERDPGPRQERPRGLGETQRGELLAIRRTIEER